MKEGIVNQNHAQPQAEAIQQNSGFSREELINRRFEIQREIAKLSDSLTGVNYPFESPEGLIKLQKADAIERKDILDEIDKKKVELKIIVSELEKLSK